MLFKKARKNSLIKLAKSNKIRVSETEIKFNLNVMRWLGVMLDPGLKLKAHVDLRLEKVRNAEARIKGITGKFGLAPGLIRRIHVAAVQSTMLYGAEIWWENQKSLKKKVEGVINRGARAVTGMWKSTPIDILLAEANLRKAKVLLDWRQRSFSFRLTSLPDKNPAKNILPVTLRNGDSAEQSSDDAEWAEKLTPVKNLLSQHLAQSISRITEVDPA